MKKQVPRLSRNPFRSDKSPKSAGKIPTRRRMPARVADPGSANRLPVRFCFSLCDHDGPWPLHTEESGKLREVLEKVSEWECLSWGEVEASSLYESYGDLTDCPNRQAVNRLVSEYESLDHIGRFRLAGRERLYGVREGGDFFILWWDPRHEVWPSPKKHT